MLLSFSFSFSHDWIVEIFRWQVMTPSLGRLRKCMLAYSCFKFFLVSISNMVYADRYSLNKQKLFGVLNYFEECKGSCDQNIWELKNKHNLFLQALLSHCHQQKFRHHVCVWMGTILSLPFCDFLCACSS